MEWMLQMVDEVDDAVATLRHGWLGLYTEIGVFSAAGAAIAALARGCARAFGRPARP
jgi:hypothetical protein